MLSNKKDRHIIYTSSTMPQFYLNTNNQKYTDNFLVK